MNGVIASGGKRQRIVVHQLGAIAFGREPVLIGHDPRGFDRWREVPVILEPDRGFEHDPVDPRGIGAGDAHREHPAHRMRHDVRPRDLEMIEKLDRVRGEHVEAEREEGLGRLSEPHLVGNDHAVSGARERGDHRVPIARRKIAAVQQKHAAPVSLTRRLDVHVRHPERVLVLGERQHRHRMGVGKPFESDPIRFGRACETGNRHRKCQGESSDQAHGVHSPNPW